MTTEGRCPGCWSLDAARTRIAELEMKEGIALAAVGAALVQRDRVAELEEDTSTLRGDLNKIMEHAADLEADNARLRAALADLLSERRGSDVTEEEDETAAERIARGVLNLTGTGRPAGTGRSLEGSSAVEERAPGAGEPPPKETP